MEFGAPIVETPYFKNARSIAEDVQHHPFCAAFERRAADCFEAYGWHLSVDKCRTLIEDLHECIHNGKQYRRYIDMYKERQRQIEAGKRKYLEHVGSDLY